MNERRADKKTTLGPLSGAGNDLLFLAFLPFPGTPPAQGFLLDKAELSALFRRNDLRVSRCHFCCHLFSTVRPYDQIFLMVGVELLRISYADLNVCVNVRC